ncbi:SCO2521 family protein [Parafrankia sp. EUN1f]|uniref:SCO2521 family protein n=1 Tax=Parafrankia sp. EUN1f TaxID=102897 RepID=UPI0001C47189|nr:SCO2521 family protein [Parafrankia sp. EUN1f]EFC79578.1 hypothetical protein FrEUN1fDRAFT_7301 [Parafrankia sp. EUN1f]
MPAPVPARARARGTPPATLADVDVLVGEVRTTLLQNSHQVSAETAARLLDLDPGSRVRSATRPFAHAVSPDERTGVHCPLVTSTGTAANGVGTVLARVSVTGGVILQASARTRLVRAVGERRLPWSHYLARPGVIEVDGRSSGDDLADGFLQEPTRTSAADPARGPLDLGAVGNRLLTRVQRMPHIDRVTLLRARRTRLRFAVTWQPPDPSDPPGSEEPAAPDIEFVVHDESLRTLRLRLPPQVRDLTDAVVVCEDLALHDWLLSTVGSLVDNSRIGVDPAADVVARIRPAIDHLLHLWMPGAKVAENLAGIWAALERRPGFSKQWASLRGQIQNQLMMAILESQSVVSARSSNAFNDGFEEVSHGA